MSSTVQSGEARDEGSQAETWRGIRFSTEHEFEIEMRLTQRKQCCSSDLLHTSLGVGLFGRSLATVYKMSGLLVP
jgi:hypothetical protein